MGKNNDRRHNLHAVRKFDMGPSWSIDEWKRPRSPTNEQYCKVQGTTRFKAWPSLKSGDHVSAANILIIDEIMFAFIMD